MRVTATNSLHGVSEAEQTELRIFVGKPIPIEEHFLSCARKRRRSSSATPSTSNSRTPRSTADATQVL
jgi:hypothetical protein